jgi:class 3 adenylate cyclase
MWGDDGGAIRHHRVGHRVVSGLLTFLFTDIEGSTARWAADRVAMTDALARHDALVHELVAARGGTVFKHTGDGVCAAFESACDAVACAREMQAALDAEDFGAVGGLLVRVGLHMGEAEPRDGDWFGPTLNRAARVMGDELLCRLRAELGDARLHDLLAEGRRLSPKDTLLAALAATDAPEPVAAR